MPKASAQNPIIAAGPAPEAAPEGCPMRRNMYATLAVVLALAQRALPLNPIHEASYSLVPRGKFASRALFALAGSVDSRADGAWALPFSLSLEPVPRAELGAGLKTYWGNGSGDHIPYMVLGAQIPALRRHHPAGRRDAGRESRRRQGVHPGECTTGKGTGRACSRGSRDAWASWTPWCGTMP